MSKWLDGWMEDSLSYSVILTVNSKVHAESMTKNLIDYLIANGYREYLLSKNVE